MKWFIESIKDIQVKHIVVCLKDIRDCELCSFLELPETISRDIEKTLKDTKNSHSQNSQMKEYFLWKEDYNTLTVFFLGETDLKKTELFFGKYFPKLPDNICLMAHPQIKLSFYEVCELSRYLYQDLKSEKKKRQTQVLIGHTERKIFEESQKKIQNIFLARDLGNMPANLLTPEVFAQKIKETKFRRAKVRVLSYWEIQKQWLWLIEAVWKWSENKPCFVLIEHIVDKKSPIHAIVWKGVTFDTGWNQLKPENSMYDMKWDMWGAAVVYALAIELDRKNMEKNFIFALPLAENVVSWNAYKPSDIIKAYNKKTVEIIHTDAEGRLVLADAISYVTKKYKPSELISIATLTGACMVALWYRYAGVMGTHRDFIQKCVEYWKEHLEAYIELPFDDVFIEKTKSDIADYKNLDRTVYAWSSMGAAFLSQFLEEDTLYTHIDIAWTYINEGEPYGRCPKTMTGFWVESLSYLLSQ